MVVKVWLKANHKTEMGHTTDDRGRLSYFEVDEEELGDLAKQAEGEREADCLEAVKLLAELAQYPNESPEADAVRGKMDPVYKKVPGFLKAASVASNHLGDAIKARCVALARSFSDVEGYEASTARAIAQALEALE